MIVHLHMQLYKLYDVLVQNVAHEDLSFEYIKNLRVHRVNAADACSVICSFSAAAIFSGHACMYMYYFKIQ